MMRATQHLVTSRDYLQLRPVLQPVLDRACRSNFGKQTAGVENGLICNRSADVWGIALTKRCFVTITWPVRNNSKQKLEATYATTQKSGPRVCRRPPA